MSNLLLMSEAQMRRIEPYFPLGSVPDSSRTRRSHRPAKDIRPPPGAPRRAWCLILRRNFSMDTAGVFAILIVLSSMGVGLHGLIQVLKRKIIFWVNHDADATSGI